MSVDIDKMYEPLTHEEFRRMHFVLEQCGGELQNLPIIFQKHYISRCESIIRIYCFISDADYDINERELLNIGIAGAHNKLIRIKWAGIEEAYVDLLMQNENERKEQTGKAKDVIRKELERYENGVIHNQNNA